MTKRRLWAAACRVAWTWGTKQKTGASPFLYNDLDMSDDELKKLALAEIKSRRKEIIQKFANDSFPSVSTPVAILMAGSPGAGKTEFSRRFADAFADGLLKEVFPKDISVEFSKVVCIDPDEIRDMLSQYNGTNAYLFQGAVSNGVAKLIDYCHHEKKSYILDGTLSKYEIAKGNIERALGRGRPVIIAYVYQDPFRAWMFTQEREKVEGRRIGKDVFIEEFFAAREAVDRLKREFGNRVQVWFIQRDFTSNSYEINLNVDKIDGLAKITYSKNELQEKL